MASTAKRTAASVRQSCVWKSATVLRSTTKTPSKKPALLPDLAGQRHQNLNHCIFTNDEFFVMALRVMRETVAETFEFRFDMREFWIDDFQNTLLLAIIDFDDDKIAFDEFPRFCGYLSSSALRVSVSRLSGAKCSASLAASATMASSILPISMK